MEQIVELIQQTGLLPVVAIRDVQNAVPLAKALIRGGLCAAEITFRTDAAEESIRAVSKAFPEMLVGAGTVLNCEQAQRAVNAGARFVVTPGFNPTVIRYAQEHGIPIFPGTSTPGEMGQAMEMGLQVVKFFPAQQCGGIPFLKAVSAPYRDLKFIPTGGINTENIAQYLGFEKVLACGGSWMVKSDLIDQKRFDEIEALTRQALEAVLGFELAHIGLNSGDAQRDADWLRRTFGFPLAEGRSSIFSAGGAIELMRSPSPGSAGHLAVKTNSIPRALHYLARQGIAADPEHISVKNGKTVAVYLKAELSGFAIHLFQK